GWAGAGLRGGIGRRGLCAGRPHWLGLKVLARLRSFGDDAALRAIADALEQEGVRIVSPLPLVPDLLVRHGPLGARRLSDEQRADAASGLSAARARGEADVAQTGVGKGGVVVAVGAVEGTDACMAGGGALGRGAVVVKAGKPRQDDRVDVPAIGPATVEACAAAGCSALAVEADATLALDRAE